ncbi:MAG: hypothetical protein Q9183_002999, partial [Haloplaca sp. 2 TL-2023]
MAEYRDDGAAAPNGPDMNGAHDHDPIHSMTPNEKQIFDYLLKPDDSFDADGVYWADMSLGQQVKFVLAGDAKETKREASNVWTMFKEDPLSPVSFYFKNMVLPGAGLGLEGYVLFSIGNLRPLFQARGSFPDCWKSPYKICNETWVAAIDYMEISGIIVGQILVGFLGD